MSEVAGRFLFQAEDGIRDGHVTGVQTCALPILTTCCSGARSAPSATATGPRSTTADDQTLPEHATCVPPGPATAQIVIGHALVRPGAAVDLDPPADPHGHAYGEDQHLIDRADNNLVLWLGGQQNR